MGVRRNGNGAVAGAATGGANRPFVNTAVIENSGSSFVSVDSAALAEAFQRQNQNQRQRQRQTENLSRGNRSAVLGENRSCDNGPLLSENRSGNRSSNRSAVLNSNRSSNRSTNRSANRSANRSGKW